MSEHRTTPPVTDDLLDAIVRETRRAPISVLRRLVGLPVRGACGEHIDAALRRRGLGGAAANDTSPPATA